MKIVELCKEYCNYNLSCSLHAKCHVADIFHLSSLEGYPIVFYDYNSKECLCICCRLKAPLDNTHKVIPLARLSPSRIKAGNHYGEQNTKEITKISFEKIRKILEEFGAL